MSWQAMEAVQDHSNADGTDLKVMYAIARYADRHGVVGGGRLNPGIRTLAEKARCHYNTVAASIDRLAEAGELSRQRVTQRRTIYRVCSQSIVTMTLRLSQPIVTMKFHCHNL